MDIKILCTIYNLFEEIMSGIQITVKDRMTDILKNMDQKKIQKLLKGVNRKTS
jgi:hypothetical protein